MISHLYTIINRLLSGTSYSDLYSSQTISSPIVSNNAFNINKTLPLVSQDQIINLPSRSNIIDVDSTNNWLVLETDTHTFVKDMPVVYNSTMTSIGGLTTNNIYYIVYSNSRYIRLSKTYNGLPIVFTQDSTPAGQHSIRLAQPITQINETTLSPLNKSIPGPSKGSLAYGTIGTNNASTLYYHDGSAYNMVKLGWGGGVGYYNNNSTFAQKYSGWLHGMGNYKIITTNEEIRLQFDYIEVLEPITLARDIVPGTRTYPVSSYNAVITIGSAGLNSIDTGTIASDTGYWVYLVYNPTTKRYGAVISKSSGVPTLPADSSTTTTYSMYQRLGWIKTNSNAEFFPSLQINNKFVYYGNADIVASLTTSVADVITLNFLVASNNTSPLYPSMDFLETVDMKLVAWTKVGTTEERKFNVQGSDESPLVSAYMGRVTNSYAGLLSGTSVNYEYILNDFPIKTGRTYLLAVNQETAASTTNLTGRVLGFKFNGDLYD